MSNKLYNILVPIDFTNRNRWAIAKAIELSNSFNCNIHLVHVATRQTSIFSRSNNVELASQRLEQMKSYYQQQLCGEGKLEISVLNGYWSHQLTDYIRQYQMDIIITGLSRFNLLHRIISSVSISRLARKGNIPVLAVRSGGLVYHYKKIVLPISNEVPVRQIRLAALLGRAYKSTVYFVSLRKHADTTTPKILDMALEVVQSISTIPVQTFLLEGQNLAQSTLEFSKKINADLIMANPLKEFRMPGLWNQITGNILSYVSKIPVVTIMPNESTQSNQ